MGVPPTKILHDNIPSLILNIRVKLLFLVIRSIDFLFIIYTVGISEGNGVCVGSHASSQCCLDLDSSGGTANAIEEIRLKTARQTNSLFYSDPYFTRCATRCTLLPPKTKWQTTTWARLLRRRGFLSPSSGNNSNLRRQDLFFVL